MPEASSWPRMRKVLNSSSVGPSPRRAALGGAAHRAHHGRAGRCRRPPRPACRSRCRGRRGPGRRTAPRTGVERPYWLFSITKSTGSFQTAARFTASWKSPSLVAPSPVKAAATRLSPRSCAARARPSATGSIAPRWLIIPTMPCSSAPKWNVRSRPFVKPPSVRGAGGRAAGGRAAPGEDAEVPVHREHVVVGLERGHDARRDRLLADAREPLREPPLPQQEQHLLLDHPRQQQRAVEAAAAPRARSRR